MNSMTIGLVFLAYTALLFLVGYLSSRKADNETFFTGNRRSPWFVVAYGMIGASLSGVTFMSVPGNVMNEKFYYLPMVLGFIAGYIVVALVLLPIYYKLNLTSIYAYLDSRFGIASHKSGASFFLLSRSLGAALRMFLVVSVLHEFVFKAMGLPFWSISLLFILLILAYTYKGGIKTIVWTDTLQTTFMLVSVFISIACICSDLGWGISDLFEYLRITPDTEIFQTDVMHKRFFLKQFVSGLFVTITMTGLDQDMMQKNLSCKNLKEAQKNIYTFSGILLIMNVLFLILGAIIAAYIRSRGIEITDSDHAFPLIAIRYLPAIASVTFIIGVLSAAYSSADGAMTAITTSFTLDILGIRTKNTDPNTEGQTLCNTDPNTEGQTLYNTDPNTEGQTLYNTDPNTEGQTLCNTEPNAEGKLMRIRHIVHLSCALLFFLLIIFFNMIKNDSVINLVYDVASYTYGPLLGLFFVGICTKWQIRDAYAPYVLMISPVLCFFVVYLCKVLFAYNFGFEILLLNGLITVLGLRILKR